ncbi:zinc transporter ZIP6-like isoform X2 [Palaemon carinicauda]|uniref:zinc transporter ZIP6-like isoform X2 n=1 Tax=Palaemon carinicauda TaxID=392227 RepID=UPI0035B67C42
MMMTTFPLKLSLMILLTKGMIMACPAPDATDDQILRDLPQLRELFDRYGDGNNVLTPEGLLKLLRSLGLDLPKDGPTGDHHASDHVTHDHNPDEGHKRSNHLSHDHNHDDDDHHHRQYDKGPRGGGGGGAIDNNDHASYSSSSSGQSPKGSSSRGHLNSHADHSHEDEHVHHDHENHADGKAGLEKAGQGRGTSPGRRHKEGAWDAEGGDPSSSSQGQPGETSNVSRMQPQSSATSLARGSTRHHATDAGKCGGLEVILQDSGVSLGDSISARAFLSLCPGVINYLDSCPSVTMDDHHDHHHEEAAEGKVDTSTHFVGHDHMHDHDPHSHDMDAASGYSADSWIGAILSMVVIGLVGLGCIMLIPALKRSQYYDQVNHFLLALAVGTLAGDALIHLLPHAISMNVPLNTNVHVQHALLGFTALGGIIIFLFLERGHNLFCGGHGHSHSHGHDPGLTLSRSKEEMDKETVGTATTIEETGSQNVDKIGEKLCKHSKHNSFIYAESTMSLDAQNCFEGCSSNVSPSSDANGNNDLDRTRLEEQIASIPEKEGLVSALENEAEITSIEKQVAKLVEEKKLDSCSAEKEKLVTSPDDKSEMCRKLSLNLDTPNSGRHRVLRQNSSSFNMVLQEYHVGHHGHSHHGHSHVTGRKDSLRAVILVGDAMHTLLDGMAIGAAFGSSVTGGVATSIAVLCHELPHKVGDFALLFEMGMKLRQAVKMMMLLWLLSLAGLVIGVMLGSIQTASPWIYSFTAGVFIYLALVDLLSELSVHPGEKRGVLAQMLLQVLGMLTGAVIMLFIAMYEHDLEELLEGSF